MGFSVSIIPGCDWQEPVFKETRSTIQRILSFAQLIICLLACDLGVTAQQKATDSTISTIETPSTGKAVLQAFTPSAWLNKSQNDLLYLKSKLSLGYDTLLKTSIGLRFEKDLSLIDNEFGNYTPSMRLRTLDDIRSKYLQLLRQTETWRNRLRQHNDEIVQEFRILHRISSDSMMTYIATDSSLSEIYKGELADLNGLSREIDNQAKNSLAYTVGVERKVNQWNAHIRERISSLESLTGKIRYDFFTKTHPAVWELNTNSYPGKFLQVAGNTLRQNLDSLTFYGKNAYLRAILFRLLVLVVSLLPVWYFKKYRKRKTSVEAEEEHGSYKFVHKYTGVSTSTFVLVIAPFIFINSPHIFTEAIFVTLCITTSVIFVKENPEIERRWIFTLLGTYILLKLMNLMVEVTTPGRYVWAFSILAIFPMIQVYRSLSKVTLSYKWVFRSMVLTISIALFLIGWIMTITGYYPLGRILMLTSFDQFFLAIILYVAMHAFIDFVTILAGLYNDLQRTTTIRVDLINRKLLLLVRTLAVIFWFWTLMHNLNATEFLQKHFFNYLTEPVSIAGFQFTPAGLFIFFLVVYLSFYLSSLLDGLFYDEKRNDQDVGKTSLGSVVVLLRLFILTAGFILGMIIAGIPLNSMGLFMGALGVGIGFGLQNSIGNLISGIIIAFEKPLYVGDIVEVDGIKGRVTDIGLRSTKIDTHNGAEYIVPNGEFIGKAFKNWTLTDRQFKIDMEIHTDIVSDPEKVTRIINEVMDRNRSILFHPPAHTVVLKEILPQALRFEISCWVSLISDAKNVKNILLTQIHQDLLKNGIQYPQHPIKS